VLLDVTEQKQLQTRLAQTERMEAVGQLASGVAHDFNNLLTIIKGYSSILMEHNPEGPDARAALEIQQAADRAASLTHQLLAFGRRQTLQPRVLDLNAIVRGLEKMLRRVLSENVDLTIELRHSGSNPTRAGMRHLSAPVITLPYLLRTPALAWTLPPGNGFLSRSSQPRKLAREPDSGWPRFMAS